jgi:archaellum biogenesis protein FlaJ (TadC family)
MYVSYALSVALMVTVFIGFVIILDYDMNYVLGGLLISYVILIPVMFRLARLIWINIFVKYDPDKAKLAKELKESGKVDE